YNSFNKRLPLTLYFDNDLPLKSNSDTLTESIYGDLLKKYIEQKELYLKRISGNLLSPTEIDKEDFTLDFFEYTLTESQEELKQLMNFIVERLENNDTIKVVVKGY